MPTAKILPGEYYVTCEDEIIGTVLGSCVSACIRDTVLGIGGMNHFMLPSRLNSIEMHTTVNQISEAACYGNYAMENLINDILKIGGQRKHLEVKLFGGARVVGGLSDIGEKNCDFVREYLKTEAMHIAAEDLRGDQARKIIFYPRTGRVRVKWLRSLHNDTIVRREKNYRKSIEQSRIEGEITLFDRIPRHD